MKRILIIALLLLSFGVYASAQYKYEFTTVKQNPATSVKDQGKTGTCWCFATNSFIESELIRMGKGEFDLSEMWIVRNNYVKRIFDNYLRQGKGNLGPGSVGHHYIDLMEECGLMTDQAYSGLLNGAKEHNHGNLQEWISTASELAVKNRIVPQPEIVNGILDAHLGKVPETFTVNGKEYTPMSFYQSLGLKASDYVEITSFTHHPYYKEVLLEIPDNWDYKRLYNVPLDEMMQIIDYAVMNGYTLCWDNDLSDQGYAFNHSIALFTDENVRAMKEIDHRIAELPIDAKRRQEMFEDYSTVDDHLEHLVGIAKDQDGVKYYIVKNSWGTDRNGTGYHYISENYMKAKTISILVNKNSIPKEIRKKLGL